MRNLASLVVAVVGTIAYVSMFGFAWPVERVEQRHAVAVLRSLGEHGNIHGTIRFTERDDHTEIVGVVQGLKPGRHGFHIHEYGDCCAPQGSCAGGHFNPDGAPHGAPDASERHVGDLGNIESDANGRATIKMKDKKIRLHGPYSVIGRAVMIHADADDLKSQPSGNAGDRVACGVIGIANPNPEKAAH